MLFTTSVVSVVVWAETLAAPSSKAAIATLLINNCFISRYLQKLSSQVGTIRAGTPWLAFSRVLARAVSLDGWRSILPWLS